MNLDALFKILMEYFAPALASWMLGEKVIKAEAISGEFTRKYGRMDNLFTITLANGQKRWLHIEFQGRRSKPQMPVRVLNYIALLMDREDALDLPLDSIVIYAGVGSGRHDTGEHSLGTPPFGVFSYKVIRLWDIPSKIFLEHESLSLLPLLGQSKMEDPEAAIAAALQKIKEHNVSIEEQGRILSIMGALLAKKEWLPIMERLAYDNGLNIETPLITKVREEGREEGHEEGLRKGLREGRELMTLEILNQRFDLDTATIVLLRKHFATLSMEKLGKFSYELLKVKDEQEFRRVLGEKVKREVDSD